MRIAVLHNHYLGRGGEDVVFEAEVNLLRQHGHEVFTYTVSNEVISQVSSLTALRMAVWNAPMYRELREWFARHRPQVAHFHNVLFVLSPAAYQAAYDSGVAVVQTLHNYRLICPAGQLMRQGRPCELCVGRRFPWPGIYYGCYKSRSATLGAALHVMKQRWARQWDKVIQVFIALSEFSRQKFIQGGLPADKVVCKPNFLLADPGEGAHRGEYALFVGRLSPEKGIEVMLRAWERIPPSIPLKVVGDGPLSAVVQAAASETPHIEYLGRQTREEVFALMREATLLMFPSIVYENMSLTILEAFATGLPVVASNLGSMATMIRHGETGWLFTPNDPMSLREAVLSLWEQHAQLREMGKNARAEYLNHYTAERNYELLIAIYERAIRDSQGGQA
jgi:glycosyltransferase involved in cell wall biosynthesis